MKGMAEPLLKEVQQAQAILTIMGHKGNVNTIESHHCLQGCLESQAAAI